MHCSSQSLDRYGGKRSATAPGHTANIALPTRPAVLRAMVHPAAAGMSIRAGVHGRGLSRECDERRFPGQQQYDTCQRGEYARKGPELWLTGKHLV